MYGTRMCFCVAGWHYREKLFTKLAETKKDIYVIAHRPLETASRWFFNLVPEEHLFLEPNLGYDWGCYQQFISKDIWKSFDLIFFMHDDINILNRDFTDAAVELINRGAQIVGNGPNSSLRNWPKSHLWCYAHSDWLPPSVEFEHDTVRGSFFAVTAEAIQQLQKFEIFWDPMRLSLRFGNHSLIATCGKLQSFHDNNCFAYLGSDYLKSGYIIEEERGGLVKKPKVSPVQSFFTRLYNNLGRYYVSYRMNKSSKRNKTFPIIVAERVLRLINGVRLDVS